MCGEKGGSGQVVGHAVKYDSNILWSSFSCQLARECTHAGCCAALGCSNEIMEVDYDHGMYIIHCSSVVFFTVLYFACVQCPSDI